MSRASTFRIAFPLLLIGIVLTGVEEMMLKAGVVMDRVYPAPLTPLSLEGLPAKTKKIEVVTADGLILAGLALPGRTNMPTLLVFHGNSSSAADTISWLAPLTDKGFGVIAAEYRGYSANPGRPSEAGLAEDARAFYSFARAGASGDLWIVGHSLGAGVAIDLARDHAASVLITIGAFSRLRAMAPGITRGLVPDEFDNLRSIAGVHIPFFLMHGSSDAVVPVSQGHELHALAGRLHMSGATLLLLGEDHRPSSRAVEISFEAIRRRLQMGSFGTSDLPRDVAIIPFGQDAALAPAVRPPKEGDLAPDPVARTPPSSEQR